MSCAVLFLCFFFLLAYFEFIGDTNWTKHCTFYCITSVLVIISIIQLNTVREATSQMSKSDEQQNDKQVKYHLRNMMKSEWWSSFTDDANWNTRTSYYNNDHRLLLFASRCSLQFLWTTCLGVFFCVNAHVHHKHRKLWTCSTPEEWLGYQNIFQVQIRYTITFHAHATYSHSHTHTHTYTNI